MATISGSLSPFLWPNGTSSTPPTTVPSGAFQVMCWMEGSFQVLLCGFTLISGFRESPPAGNSSGKPFSSPCNQTGPDIACITKPGLLRDETVCVGTWQWNQPTPPDASCRHTSRSESCHQIGEP